jgi:hypothetical protein
MKAGGGGLLAQSGRSTNARPATLLAPAGMTNTPGATNTPRVLTSAGGAGAAAR